MRFKLALLTENHSLQEKYNAFDLEYLGYHCRDEINLITDEKL
jgi:hypothetical protein